MSTQIRRHSIISSLVIYIGFIVGALNTYLFTKEGWFTEEEYGFISGMLLSTSAIIVAFATLGMPSFIYKFYPYYNDQLKPKRNDMIAWALLTGIVGFIITLIFGIAFENLFDRKFSAESPLAVKYYYWIFVFSFGTTLYNILESYTWSLHKSILTNFLKEVLLRIFTTILIILFIVKAIPSSDIFIKLYSFLYLAIALILLAYLILSKKIHLTFKVSKVTRRFFKKIIRFVGFTYGGTILLTIGQQFDSLVIASVTENGLKQLGIFTLAQFLTSIIQAPQRSVIAASIPHLAKAWKDKRRDILQRIYQRSSINQLISAAFLFLLIAINYDDAIITLKLKDAYLLGFNAFLLLGLTRIIDMGTGVNSQIIGTSNYWRFELTSGVLLIFLMLPLTYFLTKEYSIMGPAIANLISISIYNAIRVWFLWKKFRLFPFTIKTIYTLIISGLLYLVAWLLFKDLHGFPGLFVRSIFILAIYVPLVYFLNLTPDLKPVLKSLTGRFRKK